MKRDTQQRRGAAAYEEVKGQGPIHDDPYEVLDQLRCAMRSQDEVFLSRVVESARALGDAFEWQDELEDADQALYEMTCIGGHGQRD